MRTDSLRPLIAYPLVAQGALVLIGYLPRTPFFIESIVTFLADTQNVNWLAVSEITYALLGVADVVFGWFILSPRRGRLERQLMALALLHLFMGVVTSIATYELWAHLSSITGSGLGLIEYGYSILNLAFPFGLLIAAILMKRMVSCSHADGIPSPICSGCNYRLKGLNEPRCPECGRVYTLDEFHGL